MYIEFFKERKTFFNRRRNDLEHLLSMPSDKEKRPCSQCDYVCNCNDNPRTCCCNCSDECPFAAKWLSSESDRYPIEQKILPLVYALTVTRVMQPCWSCEGHRNPQGVISRIPQVWFYSPSVVYADLIKSHISNLLIHKRLNYSWDVSLCEFKRDNVSSLFTIQPNLSSGQQLSLEDARRDILEIAQKFNVRLRELAHEQLNALIISA